MAFLDDLPGFFFAGDKNDPRVNQALRQRLALQMMGQGRNKGYPKNVGEGLTAIGDSLGEMGMARRLEQADLAQQNAAKEIPVGPLGNAVAPPPAQRSSIYSPPPEDDAPPPIAAAPLPTTAATTAPPVAPPPVVPQTLPPPSTAPATFDERFNASRPSSVAPAAPAPRAALDPRSRMAALLQNRGGPLPNPTLAAANAPQDGGLSSDRTTIMATNPGASGITLAPQPAPIRPEPVRVAQATNPYDMNEPSPPSRLRMGPDEIRLRNLAQENINNPYALQRLANPIKALEDARTAEDARRVEEYKAKLQLYNQLKVKGLDYQAGTRKRTLEEQELQQKVQAGQHTTVEGRLMVPDPTKPANSGAPWIDVTAPLPGSKGGGPPTTPITKEQGDTVKFLTQIELAEEQLRGKEHILANGYKDALLGKVPFAGNALLSREYRQAASAANFGVAANLRDESGAAIGISEEAKRLRALAPALGDDEQILRDKRERRRAIMDSMRAGLGKAQPHFEWARDQMMARRRDAQKSFNDEMAGYRTSEGKEPPVGHVATNKKTGQKRIWDGTNWLETQ